MSDAKTPNAPPNRDLHDAKALSTNLAARYNTAAFSDVTVTCRDDSERLCHKIVLAMASPIWASAFEDAGNTLNFHDHDPATVDAVLAYCYSGRISVPDEMLVGIHKFAFQYQLERLQAHCERIMVEGLCPSNCLSLFAYFRRHTLPTLPDALERATAEVGRTFGEAVQAPGFGALSCDEVCAILGRDDLLVASEDVILAAAVTWLQAQPRETQSQVMAAVLDCVRWPLLSLSCLLEFEDSALAEGYVDFRDQLTRALKWHALKSVADGTARAALRDKIQDSKHGGGSGGDVLFRERAYVPPVPPIPSTACVIYLC